MYEQYMKIIGPLGNVMFYLQAYKIFICKSSESVSAPAFFMSIVGLSSWLLYGIKLKNTPLIIANGFGTVGAILTFIAILVYGI